MAKSFCLNNEKNFLFKKKNFFSYNDAKGDFNRYHLGKKLIYYDEKKGDGRRKKVILEKSRK